MAIWSQIRIKGGTLSNLAGIFRPRSRAEEALRKLRTKRNYPFVSPAKSIRIIGQLTAHPCKLRLPFSADFRHFSSPPEVIPTELLLIPTDFRTRNRRKPPFFLGSDGITFFRFPTG